MENCIFCKIARGEIPSQKVWEDEKHLAFLDVNPYAEGHVLVIPKKHSRWAWDIDKTDYLELMDLVYTLANSLRKTFRTEWVEEVIAGMGVSHTHIHLLPRQVDDGLGEIPIKPLSPRISQEKMKKIQKKIKLGLK